MSSFGDFQPEDAYDADDPRPIRLALIKRILDSLTADDTERLADVARVLAILAGEGGP